MKKPKNMTEDEIFVILKKYYDENGKFNINLIEEILREPGIRWYVYKKMKIRKMEAKNV